LLAIFILRPAVDIVAIRGYTNADTYSDGHGNSNIHAICEP
jgi:hypothetical protein